MYPDSFPMRHYLFLSLEHARPEIRRRRYDDREVARAGTGGVPRCDADDIALLPEAELRHYISDADLDPADPLDANTRCSQACSSSERYERALEVADRRRRLPPLGHEPRPASPRFAHAHPLRPGDHILPRLLRRIP